MYTKEKATNKNFRTIECLTALKHLPEPGKTTFARPAPDGEPPDVRVKSSKAKFSKRELLEFFTPLFSFWKKEIEQAKVDIESVECHTNKSRLEGLMNGKSSCYFMLQEYIEENGGE